MAPLQRLASLSGLAGTAVILAAVSLADSSGTELAPDPTQPSALLARTLVANRERTRLAAQLALLGAFLMLMFVSQLYAHLRVEHGRVEWASTLALGGGICLVVLLLVESGFYYAGSELADYMGDTQVAKVIHLWGWNSASLLAPCFGAVLLGSAAAGLRHSAFPRWLGRVSGGLFFILLFISVVLRTPGLGAFVGSLWVVVVSLALAFRRDGSTNHVGTPL